jgi:predicted dehydrogenase
MKKVRYAIIGFGGIAENRIAKEGFGCDAKRVGTVANAELVGATDVNPAREKAAKALGLKWYKNQDAILADKTIDAVFVATNNLTHAAIAEAALNAGKHVIVEKPLAATSKEAAKLVKLAKAKKLSLGVDHMMVKNVLNKKARRMIKGGKLGAVNDASFHMEFAYGYDSAEAKTWRCNNMAEMGGPIGDVASHCFYMAEFMFDSEVVAVNAVYYPKLMNFAAEDGAYVRFTLASGLICSAKVAFCEMRGGLGGTLGNLGYEIYGDKGVLRSYGTMFQLSGYPDEPFKQRLELDTFDKQQKFTIAKPENIYQGIISEHAESILKNRPLSAIDGCRNVQLCEAAHKSAKKGGATVEVK